MKKLGILVFIFALVIGIVVTNLFSFGRVTGQMFSFNFGFRGVKGSGNVITEQRDVSGFNGIDVGGVYQVEIVAQSDYSVTVEADDNIVPLIRTEVDGGVLRIQSDRRISPKSTIKIRISAPNIDDLDVSGAASVTVSELKNEELTVHSSGASKVTVKGETLKLSIDVSGATKINAEELKAQSATVDASGASSVAVNVTETLNADASGASRITYAGTPTSVQKKTGGAGSVSQR